MYLVKCDGEILYDPRIPELKIFEQRINYEANKKAGFDFTIYPSHPLYSKIKKLKSVIEVYRDDVLIWRGRWVDDDRSWHNERSMICDDDLSFFDDSIVRPYSYQGDIRPYLQQLIDSHNQQVEADKRFVLRDVTVTDDNNYITRGNINYPTTWEEINEKLIKILGGYFVASFENGVNYIDYLEDSPYMTMQTIEFGKNLLDLKETVIGADIATAIIPLGAKLKDSEGNDTDERLTIASYNGGIDYVFNQEAVDRYGWIFKTVTYDDVTIQSNLKRKGEEELAKAINQEYTLELTAVDLSHVNKTIDDFKMLEYVKAISKPHGLDRMFLINKMSIDLLRPENSKLTIGTTYASFTGSQLSTKNQIESIRSDYVKNQQIQEVRDNVTTIQSEISQVAENVIIDVGRSFVSQSEHASYRQEVSTEFKQTSDAFNYQFSNLEQWVDNLDGDTRTRFEEIVKYIRFEDGNIILGQVGNEITLKIENDIISFYQNGVEVAYFSNNKMNVEDVEVNSSLKIGKFIFQPRANGNTSFKLGG